MTAPPDVTRQTGAHVHVRADAGGCVVTGAGSARLGMAGHLSAEWHWDGRRLTVRNDRYGMLPLFYWATGTEVAVSSRIRDLLAAGAPADLDYDALAVFLRMGFFVGDDTAFAAIRAVPPAARWQWSPGTFEVTSGRRLPGRREIGRAQAIDDYLALVRQAVARAAPGDEYVLPVSGGRDSRHILFELVRQGTPPRLAVSAAKFVPNDADTRTARRLAAALGVPHVVVDRPRSQLRAELTANLAQQMCTTEGAWLLPLSHYVRAHSSFTYDGLGGDALVQSPFLYLARQCPRGTAAQTARWLIESGRRDRYLPGMLNPHQAELLSTARAVDRVAAELESHADAAFPLMSFYFWNRVRRAVAAGTYWLLGQGGELAVHTPLLDEDLFGFAASLPPEMLLDGRFHTDALLRGYPRHGHLPFADEPTRHGPRFVRDRVGYVAAVLAETARHRHWWRAWDGLLGRLLFTGGGPSRARTANRLLPFAVYLLQLDDLRGLR